MGRLNLTIDSCEKNTLNKPCVDASRTLKKQQGFILMSLMVALALISIIAVTYYWRQNMDAKADNAKRLGNQIAEYVSAVQDRMSNDSTLAVGTYQSLAFLKNTTCAGGNQGTANGDYLPCEFSFMRFQNTLMRNDPVTEITDMTSDKRTATIRINHITDKEGNNFVNSPYLGSVAINTAEARMGSDKNALYQGVSVYHYDKDNASITVDVSVTGTNSKWLCIDGCNKMEANLAFDNTKPVNAREIQDVSNIKMNNSGTAVISNANNLQIQSNAQMQSIASNILNSASNNFEATATNQAYVGGNVAKLVGNAQSVVASGSQQVTIDPSQIVFTGTTFTNNVTTTNLNSATTNINSNTTNINKDKGTVYLGNQSGTKGTANVIVNDMVIHSMQDQKLSTLLENANKPYYSGFALSPTRQLYFNVTTGMTGHALITVYGSSTSGMYIYANYLRLSVNGSILRSIQFMITGYMMYQYEFTGSPNTTYTNFDVNIYSSGAPGYKPGMIYVGWSYYPF